MIPKKPAPGLDPRVGTGFPPSRSPLWRAKEGRKRPCSNKKLEPGSDSIRIDKALAGLRGFGQPTERFQAKWNPVRVKKTLYSKS